jgi:hypothetical protein
MKPYHVQVEVTTTYTVEVHADDPKHARSIAWGLDIEEIEAQGSVDETEVTAVSHINDIEEIQREKTENE